MTNGGTKHDQEKPRMELLPLDILQDVAQVLTFGATKYGDWNWKKGFAYGRLLGACLRHLTAWQFKERVDPESGKSHLYHAIACLLFLAYHEKHGIGVDDR